MMSKVDFYFVEKQENHFEFGCLQKAFFNFASSKTNDEKVIPKGFMFPMKIDIHVTESKIFHFEKIFKMTFLTFNDKMPKQLIILNSWFFTYNCFE